MHNLLTSNTPVTFAYLSPQCRLLSLSTATCTQIETEVNEDIMSAEELKALAHEFIDAFNQHNVEAIRRLISDEYVQHSPGVPPSRDAFFTFLEASYQAFPDGRFEINDMIAEGDKVLLRWTFYGTHTGRWLNRQDPPTGRTISFSGMDLYRYNDRPQLAEAWFVADMLGLMRQLGRIPSGL
jgi:steroid delta-isomerase-like uncharacterized protein